MTWRPSDYLETSLFTFFFLLFPVLSLLFSFPLFSIPLRPFTALYSHLRFTSFGVLLMSFIFVFSDLRRFSICFTALLILVFWATACTSHYLGGVYKSRNLLQKHQSIYRTEKMNFDISVVIKNCIFFDRTFFSSPFFSFSIICFSMLLISAYFEVDALFFCIDSGLLRCIQFFYFVFIFVLI